MADINVAGTLNAQTEDGIVARAEQIDVGGTKLNMVLGEKEDKLSKSTTTASPLVANSEYFLGTMTSDFTLTLPSATAGDVLYINFSTGSESIDVTINGAAQKGLSGADFSHTNSTYELIAVYSDMWLFSWRVIK